eukprot:g54288.t1
MIRSRDMESEEIEEESLDIDETTLPQVTVKRAKKSSPQHHKEFQKEQQILMRHKEALETLETIKGASNTSLAISSAVAPSSSRCCRPLCTLPRLLFVCVATALVLYGMAAASMFSSSHRSWIGDLILLPCLHVSGHSIQSVFQCTLAGYRCLGLSAGWWRGLRLSHSMWDLEFFLSKLARSEPFAFAQLRQDALDDYDMLRAATSQQAQLYLGLPCNLPTGQQQWADRLQTQAQWGVPRLTQISKAAVFNGHNKQARLLLAEVLRHRQARVHLVLQQGAHLHRFTNLTGLSPVRVLWIPPATDMQHSWQEVLAGDVVLLMTGGAGSVLAIDLFANQSKTTFLDLDGLFDAELYNVSLDAKKSTLEHCDCAYDQHAEASHVRVFQHLPPPWHGHLFQPSPSLPLSATASSIGTTGLEISSASSTESPATVKQPSTATTLRSAARKLPFEQAAAEPRCPDGTAPGPGLRSCGPLGLQCPAGFFCHTSDTDRFMICCANDQPELISTGDYASEFDFGGL